MNILPHEQTIVNALTEYVRTQNGRSQIQERFHKIPVPVKKLSPEWLYCPESSGWLEVDVTSQKVHILVIGHEYVLPECDRREKSKLKRAIALDGTWDPEKGIVITERSKKILKRCPAADEYVEAYLGKKLDKALALQSRFDEKHGGEAAAAPKAHPFQKNSKDTLFREMEQDEYPGDLIGLGRTLTTQGKIHILLSCARVLRSLHKDGHAHGDVHHANIFLTDLMEGRLADWEFSSRIGKILFPTFSPYEAWDFLRHKGLQTRFTDIWGVTIALGGLWFGSSFIHFVRSNELTIDFLNTTVRRFIRVYSDSTIVKDTMRVYDWIHKILLQQAQIKAYVAARPNFWKEILSDEQQKAKHLEEIAKLHGTMDEFITTFQSLADSFAQLSVK